MKTLVAIAVLAALAGCATPPRTVSYAGAYAQPADPQGWRVVSVTPVAPGTGAQLAATQGTGNATTTATTPVDAGQTAARSVQYTSAPVQYTSQPVQYVSQPVYVQSPVYVPAPVYYRDPYYDYYPPVSLSLGFMFGNGGWGHRGWGRGGVGLGVGFHHHR